MNTNGKKIVDLVKETRPWLAEIAPRIGLSLRNSNGFRLDILWGKALVDDGESVGEWRI